MNDKMWHIREHHDVQKICRKLPEPVLKKYDLWKTLVFRHGPEVLRTLPGFHDEALKGQRQGERSSRLNLLYRVIYKVDREMITVFVIEVTPHVY